MSFRNLGDAATIIYAETAFIREYQKQQQQLVLYQTGLLAMIDISLDLVTLALQQAALLRTSDVTSEADDQEMAEHLDKVLAIIMKSREEFENA